MHFSTRTDKKKQSLTSEKVIKPHQFTPYTVIILTPITARHKNAGRHDCAAHHATCDSCIAPMSIIVVHLTILRCFVPHRRVIVNYLNLSAVPNYFAQCVTFFIQVNGVWGSHVFTSYFGDYFVTEASGNCFMCSGEVTYVLFWTIIYLFANFYPDPFSSFCAY